MAPYKVNQEIQEFIVESKKATPRLSCRKFISLIEGKFSVTLSKSAINAVIKAHQLSAPVGRPRKKPRPSTRIQQISAKIPELLKLIDNKEVVEADARAKAVAEAEARAKAETAERLKAEAAAQMKAEADAAESSRLAKKAEEEARARAEIEARLKDEAEARIKAEAEAAERARQETYQKQQDQERMEAEERARAETEAALSKHVGKPVWTAISTRKDMEVFSNLGTYLLKIADYKLGTTQSLAKAISAVTNFDEKITSYIMEYITYMSIFSDKAELARFMGEVVAEDAFFYYMREMSKFDVSLIQREMMKQGLDINKIKNTNDLAQENLLKINSDVQAEFFPSVYQFLDLKTMYSRFYCLPGKMEFKPGLLIIKLFYRPTFSWVNDVVWQDDFSATAKKINNVEVFAPQGEKIWLEPQVTGIENGFF